jgi:hypothetical protein
VQQAILVFDWLISRKSSPLTPLGGHSIDASY